MLEASDLLVFFLVVGARFFLPFLIFRYPLPGILVCSILDNMDQTIFQTFTNLPLDGYQSYDKALDIYYLTIAYISMFRNWENMTALGINRFLYYYRMIGVVLFELTHWRPILLIFPNTFEYFFMAIEAVAVKWNPIRLSKKVLIGIAAFIWIVIKLPQEYWIHVAQLDVTDFWKEDVFGVSSDTSWVGAIEQNLWFIPVVVIVFSLLVTVGWYVWKKLPEADWKFNFDANRVIKMPKKVKRLARENYFAEIWNSSVFEKFAMITLVSIIFAHILPNMQVTNLELGIGVGVVVIANAVFSHWFAKGGREWESTFREFFSMSIINFGIVTLYSWVIPHSGSSINLGDTIFFVLLLTLLITLYDRYRPVYDARIKILNK